MGLFDNFSGKPRVQEAEQEKKDLVMIKQDGLALQHVKNQTKDIIVAAVQQDGMALEFVKEQPPEIGLVAVRQNGKALKYVEDKTLETWIVTYV